MKQEYKTLVYKRNSPNNSTGITVSMDVKTSEIKTSSKDEAIQYGSDELFNNSADFFKIIKSFDKNKSDKFYKTYFKENLLSILDMKNGGIIGMDKKSIQYWINRMETYNYEYILKGMRPDEYYPLRENDTVFIKKMNKIIQIYPVQNTRQ